MSHRMASIVVGGGIILLIGGQAAAQGGPVQGSGTAGTIPVWTGDGTVLSDSHIKDDGTAITVTEPISGTVVLNGVINAFNSTHALQGLASGPNAVGVVGGNTSGTSGAGIYGFATSGGVATFGVYGEGYGVKGIAVQGSAPFEGVVGINEDCSTDPCTPAAGTAGTFTTLSGGTILRGNRSDASNNWTEAFRVDSVGSIFGTGDITITGNAYKPGGGSWSVPSDERLKKSVEPIGDALHKLLQLRGVTYEYVDPAAVHELPGAHIGMVAQHVEKVFPSWVDMGEDGYRRLTYRGFEAVATEAVRELNDQMNEKSADAAARIAKLERENAQLRQALEVLSETVKTLQSR